MSTALGAAASKVGHILAHHERALRKQGGRGLKNHCFFTQPHHRALGEPDDSRRVGNRVDSRVDG